jgi:hypothetical protein
VLLRGTGSESEQDVTAWTITGQARKFFDNLGWALALAGGRHGRWIGGRERFGFDER